MNELREELRDFGLSLGVLLKWLLFAALMGTVVGGVCIVFAKCMEAAVAFRGSHSWVIYLLPLGGVAIAGCYYLAQYQKDGGTNLVLSSIHSGKEIPIKMAPLIFIGTVITQFVGGSAGREGAALQLGGSIGNQVGRVCRLDERDTKIIIMCGMSAAFAALFGTPMAASVFAIEVVSVGVMHYSALVPCVFASFIASQLALMANLPPERFHIGEVPSIYPLGVGKLLLLAVCCAVVSRLFCMLMHKSGKLFQKVIPNLLLRGAVGGGILLGLTLLLGDTLYLGAGVPVIEQAMEGLTPHSAFLWKMVFTAITLGAGFKGGEIVPSLFIGATLGAAMAALMGSPVAICAAVGMVAMFCGVTNCPLASLVLAFELFGLTEMPYFFIAVAISYVASGYRSLYHDQKIMYSKRKPEFINITAK